MTAALGGYLSGGWMSPLVPNERNGRMTLMCGVITDDAVLLAADTFATGYEDASFWQPFPVVVPQEKFLETGMPSMLWGFGGFDRVAKPMIDWAKRTSWSSWSQLATDASAHSGKAVRRAKEFVRQRQGDPNDPRLRFGAMFGGFIGDEPGLLFVDPDLGMPHRIEDKWIPFGFGGGQTLVTVSWNVLDEFHPDSAIRSADELGTFMDAVCSKVAGLGHPVDVWRIDRTSAMKVDR